MGLPVVYCMVEPTPTPVGFLREDRLSSDEPTIIFLKKTPLGEAERGINHGANMFDQELLATK